MSQDHISTYVSLQNSLINLTRDKISTISEQFRPFSMEENTHIIMSAIFAFPLKTREYATLLKEISSFYPPDKLNIIKQEMLRRLEPSAISDFLMASFFTPQEICGRAQELLNEINENEGENVESILDELGMFLGYFAPEVEEVDRGIFTHAMDTLGGMEDFDAMYADHWKLMRENRSKKFAGELEDAILNDDLRKLQEISHQSDFDINQAVEPVGFEINPELKVLIVPLISYCALVGSEKCFSFLLQKDADITLEDANGWNTLHYAAAGGKKVIVDKLISYANEHRTFEIDWNGMAIAAAGFWQNSLLIWILEHLTNPESFVIFAGTSVIHAAARSGNLIGCEMLLAKLSQIDGSNLEDTSGRTPLFECQTRRGGLLTLGIAELLLAAGANIEALDDTQMTPLFTACENDDLIMIKYLVDHKANVNVKRNDGV